ncbi:Nif3-like dinuclear metal center hexameric protein [Pediococcus stilesii]|uniref:GTP cyclohydrolase 1 type 2 homolog n=1 Tax=Pediococcus stilesii TaxID=331679 RepID=A0A5R9BW58_9LACO|nr:Nif3-like dinuclear metal center hexameric protein [Pediococcus stilesii]TLQ04914.1 Nif3-like dinuclear metal center hexameric protein [Pediococcus stilesii]
MLAQQLISRFELFAPKESAFAGDPIGLQIGNVQQTVHRVLVTLDVRPAVVEEAISKKCDFIFSHHPLIFRPIKSLDLSIPQNQMYADLVKHSIVVYSAHTNLDVANNGMNDWLAEAMNLKNVKAVYSKHYDTNIGRLGQLSERTSVTQFAQILKQTFDLQGLRVITPDRQKLIKKVAVVGGDGGKFYPEMIQSGADAFVTGDVYYHTGHDMLADGLSVFDVGHNVEKICIPMLSRMFNKWNDANQWGIEVVESTTDTNPYQFM